MARIRTIKPEFCASEQVASVSRDARLLFITMWCFCDDAGVHPDNPRRLKMECFPGDEDLTSEHVAAFVDELVGAELLGRFDADGGRYLFVTGWRHQKIDRPTYKHPPPPSNRPPQPPGRVGTAPDAPNFDDHSTSDRRGLDEYSTSAPRGVAEGSSNDHRGLDERSPPEGKGRDEESKGVEPPLVPPVGGEPDEVGGKIIHAEFGDAASGAETTAKQKRSRRPSSDESRGTRVPDGELSEEWAREANRYRVEHNFPPLPPHTLRLRWNDFRQYWSEQPGTRGVKKDWLATWRNNNVSDHTERKFPPPAAPATSRRRVFDTTG